MDGLPHKIDEIAWHGSKGTSPSQICTKGFNTRLGTYEAGSVASAGSGLCAQQLMQLLGLSLTFAFARCLLLSLHVFLLSSHLWFAQSPSYSADAYGHRTAEGTHQLFRVSLCPLSKESVAANSDSSRRKRGGQV